MRYNTDRQNKENMHHHLNPSALLPRRLSLLELAEEVADSAEREPVLLVLASLFLLLCPVTETPWPTLLKLARELPPS